MGDPRYKFQHWIPVARRRADTFEDVYDIPRADWPWALTATDPTTFRLRREMSVRDAAQRPAFLPCLLYTSPSPRDS